LGIAGIPLFLAPITLAHETPRTPQTAAQAGVTIEQVIVTGSNIPTSEETGPNPVDTYRPTDLEKLGIRNTTDLLVKLPQEAGATVNQNIANGGDGSVAPNLRGLQAKETLVLIDGKRVAAHALAITPIEGDAVAGADISLIPFPMIDHIDILKDGASAVYGSDAIAGVVNFFLIHKFRGLEIGGSYGNTNLGASNDMGEWEAWLKAGTGDDKTDIVIIADFWERTGGIFSRDRDLSSNAFQIPWGGIDERSENSPGHIGDLIGFRLIPKLFFSANSPPPHSAPNVQTSPFYKNPFVIAPNAYPGPPGINFVTGLPETGPIQYKGGGDYFFYNFAAITPALPPADRQSFYGSFMRDLCDKYLVLFADFKYVRSFFDSSLAAVPFVPDPFHNALGGNFSLSAMSVPLRNPFNPFTVADATLPPGTPFAGIPVTTGVRFRAIGDTGNRTSDFITHDYLFDAGLRGQMGEFGDSFKTWNWEAGFRYSLDGEENVLQNVVSQPGLREALLDTNPATAFNPFLGIFGRNTQAARQRVYVTLHVSSQFELPLGYFSLNGDLFNLPAGPVSFALGLEYHGERWRTDPDSLNTTFNTIGSPDLQTQKLNRDVWAIYQEVRVPFTSPIWNFPGFYSFEVDFAEREEWYSQNSAQVPAGITVIPAGHTQFNMQRPKFSVRLQPLDPKWLGALTLRGSYTEAFHAPTLGELSPAGSQGIGQVHDPKGLTPNGEVVVITTGNFHLTNETAYEWSYGAVYGPKWIKGLTLSADWWHIDLRQIPTIPGPQFILEHENIFPQDVVRDPTTGAILLVINPSFNLSGAVSEGLDYEAIYILDSGIFGHGDFGRLTWTVNGTHLARARLQISPNSKPFSIAGQFSIIGVLTGSLPRDRFFVSAFYDGPANTWMQGLDIGAVVHWVGQYEDDNVTLTGSPKLNMPRTGGPGDNAAPFPQRARKVAEWTTLDLIASYTFNLTSTASAEVPGFAKDGGKNVKMKDGKEKNVIPISTAEYNPCGWRAWLNNTTLTLGMQNVFDEDPPFVAGSLENGYDESLATIKGRFCYVQLKKSF
jgi:iron complex outermembrane receptor protein